MFFATMTFFFDNFHLFYRSISKNYLYLHRQTLISTGNAHKTKQVTLKDVSIIISKPIVNLRNHAFR